MPDYELTTAPGNGEGLEVGEFALANGTASLILPRRWVPTAELFREARFAIPDLEGATFSVALMIYNDPVAIRSNALESYAYHPEFPPLEQDAKGVPDFEQMTVRASGTITAAEGDKRQAFRLWRKLNLHRPNMIRVIEAQLQVPECAAHSEAAEELRATINHLLKFTRFADHETGADRVAPSEGMKSITLWDTVHMHLPADWRGKRKGGFYAYDHETDDRWTLWIGYNVFKTPGSAIDAKTIGAEMAADAKEKPARHRGPTNITFDPMSDRPDEAMIIQVYESVEGGETLHHTVWDRIVRQGEKMIFGHFAWVVVAARRDEPDMQALSAMIEREVRDAILFDGDDDDDQEIEQTER